ncbi:MAG: potassium/proton antiporter [Bacteroidales bacterium]|jgi:cell volume regulation protein A|nr:potassium/proton antiporter [Bacteroidales bacterium]MCK9448552.1 potassium/proton antiporter [Bacteroidales bacterium]MDD3700027.1 potassium/proton antiporter [Bacteroidales bacterium]MDY0368799.1 potassium/proton antiporter [Bacteroidales bacterium]
MQLSIELYLLLISILLFVSIVVGKMGSRFGVPTLLLFLLIGVLFGSDGLGIEFNSPAIAQAIGMVALNVILFSGGMDTRLDEVKPIAVQGLILATIGVMLTALLTGLFIYWFTNNFFQAISFGLLESLLLASVMSSTDSASVFSILRSKNQTLKENLRPLLEFESGSNDPMAYMLTIVLIQLIQSPEINAWGALWMFFKQLVLGGLAGYFLGKLTVRIINKINLDNDALYAVLLTTQMLFLFGFTTFIGGNGYLAVYVGGLFIGNSRFVHKRSSMKFFDGMTWLVQILMFLTLGLLVNPSELLPIAGVGIIIGLFMIFVSRPMTVMACLAPFRRMSFKAKNYVSWVGLRGAVPIIFATYPWISEIEQAKIIFNIVFFITIISLLVQGTTVGDMAKWLKLSEPAPKKRQLKNFDVEIAEEIKSFMCEIEIKKEYLANGSRLMDLNIPEKTLIAMVKREDLYFIPRGNTELLVGDKILVITDDEQALEETYRYMKGEETFTFSPKIV